MLAIVIPYYKLTFFEQTLESLAIQTNKDFRVYIGNDASPECPNVLIEKYKNKFNFVYHRFEQNLGSNSLTQQWERCIELTNHEEWIMILGDDDVLGDNVVDVFYGNLYKIKNIETQIIRFASIVIDEFQNNTSLLFSHPQLENAAASFFRKFKGNSRSSLSEHIFSRKSFEKCKFINYPLAWHSDDMAWLDFSMNNDIFSINNAIVYIRKTSNSISGNNLNLIYKKSASMIFFTDIIMRKLSLFKKSQRLELLYHLEQRIKWDRSFNQKEYLFFTKAYIQNFRLIVFIKFVRRMILGLINTKIINGTKD